MLNAPQLLHEAQQLPEMQKGSPHIIDWSVPIYLFLDSDNCLMKVVADMDNLFYKMKEE